MTNELADVTKLSFYDGVRLESLQYHKTIQEAYSKIMLDYYRWGVYLNANIEATYADAVVERLAVDVGRSSSELYRIMQFGRRFASELAFEAFRRDFESTGRVLTWTEIKRNVLPDGMKRPELYGGEVNVVDEKMRELETMSIKMEELREFLDREHLDYGKKEEIVGVILQAQEVLAETVESLSPQLSPAAKVERSTMYLDYVRSLPCIICDQQAQAHHVEVGGVGMKGSDYVTIPLCADHHKELHDRGDITFQQWHGVDFNAIVIRCMSEFIKAIVEGGA